jgi:hypothetical protein
LSALPLDVKSLEVLQDSTVFYQLFKVRRVIMQKSLGLGVFSLVLLSLSSSAAFSFGDRPYRLNWVDDANVAADCLKWNWQQYSWYDECAAPVRPTAYMYPRSHRRGPVLRTKG